MARGDAQRLPSRFPGRLGLSGQLQDVLHQGISPQEGTRAGSGDGLLYGRQALLQPLTRAETASPSRRRRRASW